MPIIEAVSHEEPISQGDILTGIQLFTSERCWEGDGGQPHRGAQRHCMVISRPCVALHKPCVIVAAIEKYKGSISDDIKTIEDLVNVLSEIRDGTQHPDQFYLGQIAGETGSYCARLDLLHTVQVPPKDQLDHFLSSRRIGRLAADFARDLHVRIFAAFSRLGFSDHSWFAAGDLDHVIAVGEAELKKLQSELQSELVRKTKGEAHGFKHPSEQQTNSKKIAELKEKAEKVELRISPYKLEREQRNSAGQLSPQQPAS